MKKPANTLNLKLDMGGKVRFSSLDSALFLSIRPSLTLFFLAVDPNVSRLAVTNVLVDPVLA